MKNVVKMDSEIVTCRRCDQRKIKKGMIVCKCGFKICSRCVQDDIINTIFTHSNCSECRKYLCKQCSSIYYCNNCQVTKCCNKKVCDNCNIICCDDCSDKYSHCDKNKCFNCIDIKCNHCIKDLEFLTKFYIHDILKKYICDDVIQIIINYKI